MRPLKLYVALLSAAAFAAISCGGEEEVPGGNTGARTGSTGGSNGSGAKPSNEGGSGNEGNVGNTSNAGDTGDGGEPPVLVDECEAPWEGTVTEPSVECDLDNLEDSGESLSGDIAANRTLTSGKTYALDGPTRVMPGVTLTIEPCVKILGQSPSSILVVMPGAYSGAAGSKPSAGGKIEAVGEPDAPIIFTSNQPVGERRPGDWGGLMLLGNAQKNEIPRVDDVVSRTAIEGLTSITQYGWDTAEFNEESSGSLAYVRIEYASYEVKANEETNGLTLGAIGSGTTLHHIMVTNSNDDCFEWFGGAVNASHLIAYNCDDDMFDADKGFSGKVQFAFGRQIEGTLETDSNGFEFDSSSSSVALLTTAEWSNVTLCGTKEEPSGSGTPRVGMGLRNGVAGGIRNTIVTGFDNGGLFLSDASNAPIALTFSSLFDNGALYGGSHAASATWLQDQEGNSIERPEGLCDCFSERPTPWPLKSVPGTEPGEGFEDGEAAYQGAFADATPESNWMRGKWVDWSNE
jgi:hypothetical protein